MVFGDDFCNVTTIEETVVEKQVDCAVVCIDNLCNVTTIAQTVVEIQVGLERYPKGLGSLPIRHAA